MPERALRAIQSRKADRPPLPLIIFLVAGLLGGGLFLWLEPPVSTFDAGAHYFRTVQVARGEWRSSAARPGLLGGLLPRPDVEFGRHESAHGDPTEYLFVPFTGAAIYSPLNYAPQALGLAAGRALRLGRLGAYRLSALFNVIAFVTLVSIAICLAPEFSPAFAALALAPEIVRQAASQHPDAINFGVIALWMALVLRAVSGSGVLSRRHVVTLAALAVLLAWLKPAASVFLALLLAVPAKRFAGRAKYVAFVAAAVAGNVFCLLLWYRPYAGLNVAASHGLEGNAAMQEAVLRAHPAIFLETLAHQVETSRLLDFWAQNFAFISWPLEKRYFDATYLWNPAAKIGLVITVALALASSARPVLRSRVVFACTAAASFCAIVLVMWIVAGKVGSFELVRVQGRYFAPACLALACAIPAPWPKWPRARGWIRAILFAGAASLLIWIVAAVARHTLPTR
jgi:uncharacterized membrane protein